MTTAMKVHTKLNGKPASKGNTHDADTSSGSGVCFSNCAGKKALKIDAICDSLQALTGGWPKCISGVLCYVKDGEVRPLESASALFAWIGSHALVEWRKGARAVGKEELFKRLGQRERWDWATPHPHFPKVPGVLYLTKPPKAENNGKLNELIARFRPKTTQDRELIKALVLTLFWGGPPGKRPQFVIAAEENKDKEAGRGTGKSSLAQYLASLVGGCIDVDPSGGRDRIFTNILSPSSWGQRVILIDNLKASRFSSDLIEKLITRDEITGHRMYQGFAKRPNLLTWVVTVNGAFFSTDMAQRAVVIKLDRPPKNAPNWDADTPAFIKANREAIIADVRWHLEVKPPVTLTEVDRWGLWCAAVLSRCDQPQALIECLGKRREAIDGDKQELVLAVEHLRSCIATAIDTQGGQSNLNIDSRKVWAPSAWLVQALRLYKREFTDHQAQQLHVDRQEGR